MAKSAGDLQREGREHIGSAMLKIGKAMDAMMEGVTEAEVSEAFRCNQKDAPMFAHTMAKAYVAQVRIDATQAPTVQQSLSVTIIERAANNEEWLKMAAPHKKALTPVQEKLPAAIDVVAVGVAAK